MRKTLTNILFALPGVLAAIDKWGGRLVDLIGLPEAAKQLEKWRLEYVPEIGKGTYWLIGFSILGVLLVNFWPKAKTALRKATGKDAEHKPAFIKAGESTNTKIHHNVFVGNQTHIDAERAENLQASSNVHLTSAPDVESAQRQMVPLLDAFRWIIGNAAWEPGHSPDSNLGLAAIEVRQAARDSEITIRGRREIDRHMPGETFDQTWENIEPDYWRTHDIDVGGIMTGGYAHQETRVISPGDLASESMPHYGMLRIYKHEMETRWPPASEPNISVWLAMRWLADPKNLSEFIGNIQPFCQKAFEGKITVWGKEAVYSRRKKLPTGYWEFYTICPDSLFRESSHGATSELLDKNLKNVTMPKMIKLETIWWQAEHHLKGNGDGLRQISKP